VTIRCSVTSRVLLSLVGLASLVLAGCDQTAPTPTPQPAPVAAAQPSQTPAPTITVAPQPSATPPPATQTSAPTAPPTFTVVRITPTIDIGTPVNTGVDRLKPQDVPTAKPAVTSAAQVTPKPEPTMGGTKPTATRTGPQPTAKPGVTPTVKPITKLQVSPTPVVTRKGQPNANVDPQKYVNDLLVDLQALAGAMDDLNTTMDAWQSGDATEEEVVSGVQSAAQTMNQIYVREVQRDYPPQLKEIDDYYVETLRAGDRMFQLIVKMMQTGDTSLTPQIQKAAQDFQFYGQEFIKRIQKL
jgi:hypothetical protein